MFPAVGALLVSDRRPRAMTPVLSLQNPGSLIFKPRLPSGSYLSCGGFPKIGVPFWGPHNKDYNILGSILGSPHFGKLPNRRCKKRGFWQTPISPRKPKQRAASIGRAQAREAQMQIQINERFRVLGFRL